MSSIYSYAFNETVRVKTPHGIKSGKIVGRSLNNGNELYDIEFSRGKRIFSQPMDIIYKPYIAYVAGSGGYAMAIGE